MIDKEFLSILACPICKNSLEYNEEKNVLICPNCKVFFPIEDNIPLLTTDYAKPLQELN